MGHHNHFRNYAPKIEPDPAKLKYGQDRFFNETNRPVRRARSRGCATASTSPGRSRSPDFASWPWIAAYKSQAQNLEDFPRSTAGSARRRRAPRLREGQEGRRGAQGTPLTENSKRSRRSAENPVRPESPHTSPKPFVLRMRRELEGTHPEPNWPAGIRIYAINAKDKKQAMAAHAVLGVRLLRGRWRRAKFLKWWSQLRKDGSSIPRSFFLASDVDGVVGICQCWTSNFIKDVAVVPRARRRGICARPDPYRAIRN